MCRLAPCTSISCRTAPHVTVQAFTSLCSSGSCIIDQRLRSAVQHRCPSAKGLRYRISPVCTLSQNGYGDCIPQTAESQVSPCYMTSSNPASSRRRESWSERVSETCPSGPLLSLTSDISLTGGGPGSHVRPRLNDQGRPLSRRSQAAPRFACTLGSQGFRKKLTAP